MHGRQHDDLFIFVSFDVFEVAVFVLHTACSPDYVYIYPVPGLVSTCFAGMLANSQTNGLRLFVCTMNKSRCWYRTASSCSSSHFTLRLSTRSMGMFVNSQMSENNHLGRGQKTFPRT